MHNTILLYDYTLCLDYEENYCYYILYFAYSYRLKTYYFMDTFPKHYIILLCYNTSCYILILCKDTIVYTTIILRILSGTNLHKFFVKL